MLIGWPCLSSSANTALYLDDVSPESGSVFTRRVFLPGKLCTLVEKESYHGRHLSGAFTPRARA